MALTMASFNLGEGKVVQIPLHDAKTVPEAVGARQVIKDPIKAGTYDFAKANRERRPDRRGREAVAM